MPATAPIRVATRALRGWAAVCVLGVLCCAPAKALSFSWSFQITGASNSSYIGQAISGTIDNLQDNAINRNGMTATVSSAPFGPGSGGDWATISLSYAGGNGIAVRDGVVESTGLQAFFIYNGQDRLILQNSSPNRSNVVGNYDSAYRDSNGLAYSNGNGNAGGSLEVFYPAQDQNSAWNDGATPTFTAVPAPLPLLGLGAATAFSRQLKLRIALRRKRAVEGDKA